MVFFEDKDEDGFLITELDAPSDPEDLEVIQRLWYYPFGMDMEGIGQATATPYQAYRYNGKELDEATGHYFYGFRMYDPAFARFTGVDPIADQFAHLSVYNYASNDPVKNIDLHGLQGVPSIYGDGPTPSAAGILFEGWQNVKAATFNFAMRGVELAGYSSSPVGMESVTRMRVNYDEYGGIPYGNPVKIVTENKKGILAETIDIAADALALTPLTEFSATRSLSTPFLAARVPSSSLKSLIPTEAGAQSSAAIKSIMQRLEDGDWFLFSEPIHTVKVDGKSYILDGHHRVEAAIQGGHDLQVTPLTKDQASSLYPDKYQQIIDGEF